MANQATIRLVEACADQELDHVRHLLHAFATEYAPLVAEVFAVQRFATEVAGLPGRYAPPSGSLLLAMEGDTPAGCVALRDLGQQTCEMKRLYVATTHRGRGLGRVLVAGVIQRAEQIGYERMVLDTLPEMIEAIALYRGFGFVMRDSYWEHPTAGAVFMEKRLGNVNPALRSPANF